MSLNPFMVQKEKTLSMRFIKVEIASCLFIFHGYYQAFNDLAKRKGCLQITDSLTTSIHQALMRCLLIQHNAAVNAGSL